LGVDVDQGDPGVALRSSKDRRRPSYGHAPACGSDEWIALHGRRRRVGGERSVARRRGSVGLPEQGPRCHEKDCCPIFRVADFIAGRRPRRELSVRGLLSGTTPRLAKTRSPASLPPHFVLAPAACASACSAGPSGERRTNPPLVAFLERSVPR